MDIAHGRRQWRLGHSPSEEIGALASRGYTRRAAGTYAALCTLLGRDAFLHQDDRCLTQHGRRYRFFGQAEAQNANSRTMCCLGVDDDGATDRKQRGANQINTVVDTMGFKSV